MELGCLKESEKSQWQPCDPTSFPQMQDRLKRMMVELCSCNRSCYCDFSNPTPWADPCLGQNENKREDATLKGTDDLSLAES